MGDRSTLAEWATDYWHFTVALITGGAGLWLGTERTKWKVSQILNEQEKQDLRQKNLEDRQREMENAIARIEAGREAYDRAVLDALADIKQQLHEKADK